MEGREGGWCEESRYAGNDRVCTLPVDYWILETGGGGGGGDGCGDPGDQKNGSPSKRRNSAREKTAKPDAYTFITTYIHTYLHTYIYSWIHMCVCAQFHDVNEMMC